VALRARLALAFHRSVVLPEAAALARSAAEVAEDEELEAAGGEEGAIVLQFDVPFPIQDARLAAGLAVWTTGDPFPYDPGAKAALDVSQDGQNWTTVAALEANRGGFASGPHDIGGIVAGSSQVWVRARLVCTREWPGDGMIFAQFMRTTPDPEGGEFDLSLTGANPPVIPGTGDAPPATFPPPR
jgi:hypothetical protein